MEFPPIHTLAENVRTNSEKLQRLANRRRQGLWVLVASAACYAIVILVYAGILIFR